MAIKTENVTLPVEDGTKMNAYVARPVAPKAGLMVFQEAFGVNQHIRELTERFAGEGYLAIAPEFFHRSAPGFQGDYTDFGPVRELMGKMTVEGMQQDIRATFDWLKKQGVAKTGSIGYCMGGRATFLAAATVEISCGVSYYGGGIAPNANSGGLLDKLPAVKAPLLFFWGGLDKHIGPEQSDAVAAALRAVNKPFINVEISDADHGFFCDARASYNAQAAAQSWAMTTAFLQTHLL